jgi:protein farnesyltransferase subunit beta
MTFVVKGQKDRHRVVFKRRAMASLGARGASSSASNLVDSALHGNTRLQPSSAEASAQAGDGCGFHLQASNLPHHVRKNSSCEHGS